jgi:ribosomal small subunit protein bTHX
MGKGDRKTRKGKIWRKSFGNRRLRKKKKKAAAAAA